MLAIFLDDKNTLCNSCSLNRMISSVSKSSFWTVLISNIVTNHKLLEDVIEESLQIPSLFNRFQCNRPDEPLKASRRPAVSSR
jgi:hypothetical protein